MAQLRCPGCAAPFDPARPDPLARCEWCAALLAPAHAPDRLAAAAAVDAAAARRAVLAALPKDGPPWRAHDPLLVAYPFADDGDSTRPLRPLAALPPALEAGWRATGSDLAAGGDDPYGDDAIRVAAAAAPPPGARLVLYPFWRVPLVRGSDETAAWCDAVDGQVLIPDELVQTAAAAPVTTFDAHGRVVPLAGLALGAALPLPWSIAPLLLALALTASGATRGSRP